MPRPDRLFKSTCNSMLDRLLAGAEVHSKSALARDLGVSRTTVRAVLNRLEEQGIIRQSDRQWRVIRRPERQDYFDTLETLDVRKVLEQAFMQMVQNQELKPGSRLNEGQLARRFDVSVQTLREFLIGLSRFGFVRKDQSRRWVLEGVTETYAMELHDVRVMFECRAIDTLCSKPDTDPFWGGLMRLQQEHATINARTDFSTVDFPSLDTEFHRFLNVSAGNRLIMGFQDAISMIFNYHYLWPLDRWTEHHTEAARDHLEIMQQMLDRDRVAAKNAMQHHLDKTRIRFLKSLT